MGGELYLFVNGKRTGCKVLMWDGTGLCIFMKKLERGRFADLWSDGGGAPVRLTSSELALFIEGCALVGKKTRRPNQTARLSTTPTIAAVMALSAAVSLGLPRNCSM